MLSHFSRVQLFATPVDCSPPGSSVHGILQARILEWVAIPSSRGSSQPRDQTCVSHIASRYLPSEPLGKSNYLNIQNAPCGSTGKESTCSAGDLGLIPGLGQIPWRRERLQYSGLENSMDCIVHGFSKSQAWLSGFHLHFAQSVQLWINWSNFCFT